MVKLIRIVCLTGLLTGILFACAPCDITGRHVSDQEKSVSTPSLVPTFTPEPTFEPTPEPMPETTADLIEKRIASMSDKELIGQMVMIGFKGTQDVDIDRAQLIQDYGIGNVMLFGKNIDTFDQTKALTAKIQSYSTNGIPLNIAIDIEGGKVVRFVGQWKPAICSAQALGKANDPQRVYEQYRQIGQKLHETGITIDFAPVLDIAPHLSGTFLGSRMFGSDCEKVSALIREAIKGLHDGGVASLGKHFPGHGETAEDSHNMLPVMNVSLEKLTDYSLVPFAAAVDEGIDAILVAHLSYPQIDEEHIASVSPIFITELLRETMGFGGVIISDDMRMQGLRTQHTVGEGAVLHILAGGDIALIGQHYSLQKEVLDSLYQAVLDGRISRERLEQSVRRILVMKQAYMDFL